VKAVNATCNMHGDEIIFEYHAVTIILQTLHGILIRSVLALPWVAS
jgi:hypothetical protein